MLTVGLFMAFTVPAFGATTLSVSGSYKVVGLYVDNPKLTKANEYAGTSAFAAFDQRLRLQPEFKIAEGLTLVTRLDVLEKLWEQNKYGNAVDTAAPNTNLSWERVYVDFTTGIGRFMVGYQNFTSWGTAMADGANSYPGIKYIFASGPFTVVAALEQITEGQAVAGTRWNAVDVDRSAYDLGVIYKFSGGEAGILYQYGLNNTTRTTANYRTAVHVIDPYVKMTFGPVYVEAEGIWLTGKAAEFDNAAAGTDVDADQKGFYIKANVDLKPAYVGAIFLWSQGDDGSDATKVKSGWLAALSAGSVFEPCLIFGSYWYNHAGTGGSQVFSTGTNGWTYFWDNVWFAQGYVGVKPDPKIDVFLSYSWMKADKKPAANWVSDAIGSEIDLKVSYKIFDNLEYMIGGAYFFTGDYFKGTSDANKIDNNYLLLHQLNLTF
jgi:hypothetical protein